VTGKTPVDEGVATSYVLTWMRYIDGNVVSETDVRLISNLLSATAPRVVAKTDASDTDSDDSDMERFKSHAGNMGLVHDTLKGIARHDTDEGRIGFGRYATCIRMGRDLWETPELNDGERRRATERFFDDGTFPETDTALKAAQEAMKLDDERPQAFKERTQPYAHLTVREYGARINDWFDRVAAEAEPPTTEQTALLRRVAARILREFAEEKIGDRAAEELHALDLEAEEEPVRALVHGPPGTGKSRAIKFIRRLFEEALGWQHGVEFICVAFQNRMAAAIGGTTLHSGADLPRPGENRDRKLDHSEIDNLYIRNASLRWVLMDEISMIADTLLGEFESQFSSAARQTQHAKRRDKTHRICGGYNMLLFGDWWQLPPIPDSGALFLPPSARSPADKQSERARRVLEMFWRPGADSINYLCELTVQRSGSMTRG